LRKYRPPGKPGEDELRQLFQKLGELACDEKCPDLKGVATVVGAIDAVFGVEEVVETCYEVACRIADTSEPSEVNDIINMTDCHECCRAISDAASPNDWSAFIDGCVPICMGMFIED
jgi:hypothetical protein